MSLHWIRVVLITAMLSFIHWSLYCNMFGGFTCDLDVHQLSQLNVTLPSSSCYLGSLSSWPDPCPIADLNHSDGNLYTGMSVTWARIQDLSLDQVMSYHSVQCTCLALVARSWTNPCAYAAEYHFTCWT